MPHPCRLLAVLLMSPLLALAPLRAADDPGKLIFQDDFARTESQEKTDEPGNGWGTNSKSRAKGHKQVDLRDGAMYIYLSAEADHAVSVTHAAEFTDGTVATIDLPASMVMTVTESSDGVKGDSANNVYKPAISLARHRPDLREVRKSEVDVFCVSGHALLQAKPA